MRRFGHESAYPSFVKPALFYFSLSMALLYISLPYMQHVHKSIIIGAAFIGSWRYSLMLINYVRAYIYAKRTYPAYLKAIKALPLTKRYPEHLYLIIPSYKEDAWVTTEVFQALFSALNQLKCSATIVVATGSPQEDSVIRNVYEAHPSKESAILDRRK